MKRIVVLTLLTAIIMLSCRQEAEPAAQAAAANGESVATGIIYDVTVIPETDDSWEMEKVEGYYGRSMIDGLFDGLYSGTLKATDYHSGTTLSPADIKKIEAQPGFERENIGRIQFTEDWYYSSTDQAIEKRIKSVVFGYRSGTLDNVSTGYIASFTIHFN